MLLDGSKATGDFERTITRSWGDKQARWHYHKNNIIPAHLFDSVYWDGVEKVIGGCSEMFSVWATKQVSGFNETITFSDTSTVGLWMNALIADAALNGLRT